MNRTSILILGSKRFSSEMVDKSKELKKERKCDIFIGDGSFNFDLNLLPVHTIYIYNKYGYIPINVYDVINQAKKLDIAIEYLQDV